MKIICYPSFCMLILLSFNLKIGAQDNCIKGISTNPNNSINKEFDTRFPGLINPLKNKFNWGITNFSNGVSNFKPIELNPSSGWNFITTNPNSIYIRNPFGEEGVAGEKTDYKYILDPYLKDNSASIFDRDYHWENGWELLYLNTGFFPNGDPYHLVNPNSIAQVIEPLISRSAPYFILYNRYTGKMRYFVNILKGSNDNQINQVLFSFKHDVALLGNNSSGIFRNTANFDRPLDVPTTQNGASTRGIYTSDDTKFHTSDVQLSYDPCVCNYASEITFDINKITESTLNLYGRELETTVPASAVSPDFLDQSSINQAAGSGSGQTLLYKKTATMFEDYQKQLDNYNNKLKDYNSSENKMKRTVIELTKTALLSGVPTALPEQATRNFILKYGNNLIGNLYKIDTSTAAFWYKEGIKASQKILGEQFDFLSMSLFEDALKKPEAPTMPTATLKEMRITGSIKTSVTNKVATVKTPGTLHRYKSNTELGLVNGAVYNEAVGLFALLEMPKIILYNKQVTDVSGNTTVPSSYISYNGYQVPQFDTYFFANTETFIKLAEPLKYRFNHVLDFNWDKTNVQAVFIIEMFQNDNAYNTINNAFPHADNFYSDFENNNQNTNFNLKHNYFYNNIINKEYVSPWMQIQNITTKYFKTLSNRQAGITSLFSNQILEGNNKNIVNNFKQNFPLKIKSIKLKIMAEMYFKSKNHKGGEINTNQVFTYLLYDAANPQAQTSNITYASSEVDFYKATPGKVVLYTSTIGPTSPSVTSVVGNSIYINATEEIEIRGHISVQSGYKLFIQSHKQVRVFAQSKVDAEITLRVLSRFDPIAPSYEVSEEELRNFCSASSGKYKANILLYGLKQIDESSENAVNNHATNGQHFQLMPNPATDKVHITYLTQKELSIKQVVLTNALGVRVYNQNIEHAETLNALQNIELNTENLSAGLYIVTTILSNRQTLNEKLIIAK